MYVLLRFMTTVTGDVSYLSALYLVRKNSVRISTAFPQELGDKTFSGEGLSFLYARNLSH